MCGNLGIRVGIEAVAWDLEVFDSKRTGCYKHQPGHRVRKRAFIHECEYCQWQFAHAPPNMSANSPSATTTTQLRMSRRSVRTKVFTISHGVKCITSHQEQLRRYLQCTVALVVIGALDLYSADSASPVFSHIKHLLLTMMVCACNKIE